MQITVEITIRQYPRTVIQVQTNSGDTGTSDDVQILANEAVKKALAGAS
jgi:hypothetical protein